MLELKNVSKFYYQKGMISTGFSRLNLKLEMGEFVVITGESGSGKSTLLNVLSGLDTYEDGEMLINGEETSHYVDRDFEKYRKKYIGNIFQNFNLVNSYTVYQNVELVLLLDGKKSAEVIEEVDDVIAKVGLAEYRNTKVAKLSGGQKQRVAIARALAKDTPIIVADEPTGSLDSESALDIVKLLSDISKDKLVIIVTHNLEQVEQYATRLIKMHDGKILEDERVKPTSEPDNTDPGEPGQITAKNKIKLGTRNAFNILPKFVLLFAVFFFISMSLLGVYSSFSESNDGKSQTASTYYFTDTSEDRIVLNKKDGTIISKDELAKLSAMDNVRKVTINDFLLDMSIEIDSDEYYIGGTVRDISQFKGKLDKGTMPTGKCDVILVASEDDYMFSDGGDDVLKQEYQFSDAETGDAVDGFDDMHITGVKFSEASGGSSMDSDYIIYASPEVLEAATLNYFQSHCEMTYRLNGTDYSSNDAMFEVVTSKDVPRGKAYASEDIGQFYKSGSCLNKKLIVKAKTLYYTGSDSLKISKTYYSKETYKKLFGSSQKYDESYSRIYVNPEDMKGLFSESMYQCSLYVEKVDDKSATLAALSKAGYDAISVSDTLFDPLQELNKVLSIFKTGVLVVLIIALFFISYFVIRIIFRSRKSYFATIRTLGGMNRDIKEMLIVELFVVATMAFLFSLLLIGLVGLGVVDVSVLKNMCEHLGVSEYVILYIVISGMSCLISIRYARSIFKSSVIGTFNEEV